MKQKLNRKSRANCMSAATQHIQTANFAAAISCLEPLVKKRQDATHDVLNLYAICLAKTGQLEQALDHYQQADALAPHRFDYLTNLAAISIQLNKKQLAIDYLEQALALQPQQTVYRLQLAKLLLEVQGAKSALTQYDYILKHQPRYQSVELWQNFSIALFTDQQYDRARDVLESACQQYPNDITLLTNLGNVYSYLEQHEQAETYLCKALALAPNNNAILICLARAYIDQLKIAQAEQQLQQVLTNDSNSATAHRLMAVVKFYQDDYSQAWQEHRWRLNQNRAPQTQSQPMWQGEAIPGQTLLLHSEQGIGDSIQCLRYLEMVKQQSQATLVVSCQPGLIPLLKEHTAIDHLVANSDNYNEHDTYCSLMSLPAIFNTQINSIPATPYLATPSQYREKWSALLPSNSRKQVGLVWAGSPKFANDSKRSLQFDELAPLLALHDIEFYSLQKGPQVADIHTDYDNLTVLDLDLADFADTAAAVEQVDLVISVDTSVAHLTGALKQPCWLLLPYVPDWRWGLEREDSPWYPSLRLFRQDKQCSWEPVIANIVAALKEY